MTSRSAEQRNPYKGTPARPWVRIPELALDEHVMGYASDAVLAGARASSPDFEGLAGLPLLRLTQYGGDRDWFWLRPPAASP
jgi:hypothetical protein